MGNTSYSKTVKPAIREEKMTRLHFFYHDILNGENPSGVLIARPNITQTPPPFGNLIAMNDILTTGPEPTCKNIGNALGLYVMLSRDPTVFNAVFYADFAFTSGRFDGSSFSLFSQYVPTNVVSLTETVREMAIVGLGGRGAFKIARGFALVLPVAVNAMTGDAA